MTHLQKVRDIHVSCALLSLMLHLQESCPSKILWLIWSSYSSIAYLWRPRSSLAPLYKSNFLATQHLQAQSHEMDLNDTSSIEKHEKHHEHLKAVNVVVTIGQEELAKWRVKMRNMTGFWTMNERVLIDEGSFGILKI